MSSVYPQFCISIAIPLQYGVIHLLHKYPTHRRTGSADIGSHVEPAFAVMRLLFDRSYAVTNPKGIFASGRAEPTILLGKKVARSATFFPREAETLIHPLVCSPPLGAATPTGRWSTEGMSISFRFPKKIENVPCCRRRSRLPSGQTSGLNVHRVSPVFEEKY